MDTIISALYTSAIIASSITAVVILVTATWIIGSKIASPFGIIWSNACIGLNNAHHDHENPTTQQNPAKSSQYQTRRKLESILSGAIAMMLVFGCVVFEFGLAEAGIRYISLWDYCVLVLKGIFEAFAALGMLRGALVVVRRLLVN